MFVSREEVIDYLSGDEIECLECGKLFKGLGPHLPNAHNMTVPDYKSKYGIPQTFGLSGRDSSNRRAEATKKRHENGQLSIAPAHTRPQNHSESRAKPEWHQKKFLTGGFGANRNKAVSEETCEIFIQRVASGRSVKSVCGDEDMPSHSTVYNYAKINSGYSQRLKAITKQNKSALIKQLRAGEKAARSLNA